MPIPVAIDEIAREGSVMEREIPRPAGTPLIVVEHHPAQPLYVGLKQLLSAAPVLDVFQLTLVRIVPVFPTVLPQPHLLQRSENETRKHLDLSIPCVSIAI